MAHGRRPGRRERARGAPLRGRGRRLAGQARDAPAGLGDDGPDARPAALPQPLRPRARSPAGRPPGRPWPWPRSSSTTRPAPTPAAASASRRRSAASSASSRPTAPCRWTAACPTRPATTPAGRWRAACPRPRWASPCWPTGRRPTWSAASTACASPCSTRSSSTTCEPAWRAPVEEVARELGARAAGARLDARGQPHDGRALHRRAGLVRARERPGAWRPRATTRRRSRTSSRRAALTALAYLDAHRKLAEARERCARAAAAADILLCPSSAIGAVPIGPDQTLRLNALTKPFNGLRWPAALDPLRARRGRPAARAAGRLDARPRRRRAARGSPYRATPGLKRSRYR